jgi:hypothetical protein
LVKDRKYVIGKAKDLKSRNSNYSKLAESKPVYYISLQNSKKMKVAEDMVLELLDKYREKANRDRVILPVGEDIKLFTNVFNDVKNMFYKEI